MTVKELIQDNSFIGDISIDIRSNRGASATPGYENRQTFSRLQQDWHIGKEEGIKPPYHSKVGTYIEKSINEFDDGKDYYNLVISRIPKELLDLHVTSWRVWKCYRGFGNCHYNNHDLQRILIDAWTTETKEMADQQAILQQLEKARKREERTAGQEDQQQEQLLGQMDINDWLGSD